MKSGFKIGLHVHARLRSGLNQFESGEVYAFFYSLTPTTDAHNDGIVALQFVFPEPILSSAVLSGIVQAVQSCLTLSLSFIVIGQTSENVS